MPLPPFYTPPGDLSADQDEQYVPLEAIAQRLGISSSILIRRVEAGDIPARRVQGGTAPRYELLLSDLGLEPEDAPPPPPPPPAHAEPPPAPPSMREQTPPTAPAAAVAPPEPVPISPHFVAAPPEPEHQANGHAASNGDQLVQARPIHVAAPTLDGGVLSEVSTAPIDPRELVAGLLDRWERTLEHRIYAEQQQRFESELAGRQALLKELQMELQTARAEHAAAQADKDRALAERDRALADRERELVAMREAAAGQKRSRFFRR